MFRFSIRDILWLMVIIGFCLHAWTERFARDVAWRRRVTDEVIEREAACHRAKVAEQRASRYLEAMRKLQIEVIWARHAARAAQSQANHPDHSLANEPAFRVTR